MRCLSRAIVAGAGLIAILWAHEAVAANGRAASKAPPAPRTQSVGSPNEGRLEGGRRLEGSKSIKPVRSHRWGVPSLVGMLERSAGRVAKRFPGSVLVVGDLSRKGGGEVDGHRSHESGRDADVGFYYKRGKKQWMSQRFLEVDEEGKAVGFPSVTFDDARNWALVEAWLTDNESSVQMVLVAQHVKLRLLAQGRRAGASPELLNRAAGLLIQPSRGLPHDNHFHVRVACPRSSDDCIEYGTREVKAKKADARGAPTNKLARRAAPKKVPERGSSPPRKGTGERRTPTKS